MPGEQVEYEGPVNKRKGLFSKRRQLILTDGPRLLYIDEEKVRVVMRGAVIRRNGHQRPLTHGLHSRRGRGPRGRRGRMNSRARFRGTNPSGSKAKAASTLSYTRYVAVAGRRDRGRAVTVLLTPAGGRRGAGAGGPVKPARTYYLEDLQGDGQRWIEVIEAAHARGRS